MAQSNMSRLRFQLWFPFTPSVIGVAEDEIGAVHNRPFAEVLASINEWGEWKCEQCYFTDARQTHVTSGVVDNRFFPVSFPSRSGNYARQWSTSALLHMFFRPPEAIAIFNAYGRFTKALALVARIRRVPHI